MRLENTFRIDYSSFLVKLAFKNVHGFCRTVLGLKKEDVLRLQCSKGEQCGPTAPSLTSSAAFPELPKPPSRTEQSATVTKASSQSDNGRMVRRRLTDRPKSHRSYPNHCCFGNCNEAYESSESTSSRRSRGLSPSKKTHREDDDDEEGTSKSASKFCGPRKKQTFVY